MNQDKKYFVRAFYKKNGHPVDNGKDLTEREVIQLEEASIGENVVRNGKSLTFDLLRLLSGEIPSFIWNNKQDVYNVAAEAYLETVGSGNEFKTSTFLYFDKIGCIDKPIFVMFSRIKS